MIGHPWTNKCQTCYWYQVIRSTLSCKNESILCTWQSKEEREEELHIENKGW